MIFCLNKANMATSVNRCLQRCVNSSHDLSCEGTGCMEVCAPERINISSSSSDNVQYLRRRHNYRSGNANDFVVSSVYRI